MSIPAGTYRARVTSAAEVQFGYTSTGNEQIAVPLTITDGEHAGTTITWFGNFGSDKATEIALKALRACGWAGNDLSDLTGIDTLEVDAVVEWEEYNGQSRMKVKWLNAPGGGRVKLDKPMNDAQRRAFAAKMKGAAIKTPPLATSGASAPRASSSSQRPANGARPPSNAGDAWEPPSDDDMPL